MEIKLTLLILFLLFVLSISGVKGGTHKCLIKSDTYNCSFCPNVDTVEICTPHNIDCIDTICNDWITEDYCEWVHGVDFCNYTFTSEDIYLSSYCSAVANWNESFCFYYPPINSIDFGQFNYLNQYGNKVSNHNICVDNTTLGHNITYQITIDQNRSFVNVWVTEPCEYGCDNVTMSCQQATITNYSIYFIVIIALLIGFGVLYKMFRGW